MFMKYTLFLALAAVLLGCQPSEPGSVPKKAVFIILDGIPADVLEKVATPTLDEIAAAGGYTRAYVGGETGLYNETPTISAPGYTDLLTGAWANKHNVWDNYDQSPNYRYWNLFRILEQADSSLKTAVFSTWLDNRTVLVGEGRPGAGDFRLDYAFDGFERDTVRFPHDADSRYILAIDELVSDEAGRYIADKGPDLSWVYLEFTDDMGHRFGDSEAFYEAVQGADRQVKKVWDAIKKRQALGEDWLLVVTTDHGRDSITGKDHGGQSPRERTTWIVTNASGLNSRFTDGEPAITDIAPSILVHLGIAAPEPVRREMDGISFIGDVSFDQLRVSLAGDTLTATWHPIRAEGKARLEVAFTNHFRDGGDDSYELLGEIPVAQGAFQTTLNTDQLARYAESGFLKVVLRAPANEGNRWVVRPGAPGE